MTYFDLIKGMSVVELSKVFQILSYCDHGTCDGCLFSKIYPYCHDYKSIYEFLLSDVPDSSKK